MLWHVRSSVWLMLLTIVLQLDELLLKETETQSPDGQRTFRFNEVADFADVVEPAEELRPQGEVREKKNADEEEDASTLRVALELTGEYRAHNKRFDLSLEDKEEGNQIHQHKRNVPRKYTNLLDLKYYYSKGLPIRGHLLSSQKLYANQLEAKKRDAEQTRTKRQSAGNADKRNALNILPMMAENNPYMSKLADATNDAYLKMRNYAATLMLILTTPRLRISEVNYGNTVPSEQRAINTQPMVKSSNALPPNSMYNSKPVANQQNFFVRPQLNNKAFLRQKVKKSIENALANKTLSKNANSLPHLQRIPVANIQNSYIMGDPFPIDNQPIQIRSESPVRSGTSYVDTKFVQHNSENLQYFTPNYDSPQILRDEAKVTTLSPLIWEESLLKEANIKLRRQADPSAGAGDTNESLVAVPTPAPGHHEISAKVLTPLKPDWDVKNCILNQHASSPDDVDCEGEDEDESEDCTDQFNNQANITNPIGCGALAVNSKTNSSNDDIILRQTTPPGETGQNESQSGQHQPPPLEQDQPSNRSEGGATGADEGPEDNSTKCNQYWTVPQSALQKSITEAMHDVVAPVKALTDIKPAKAGDVEDTDNMCVKNFIESTANSTDFVFPTVQFNLNSMASQVLKCEGPGNPVGGNESTNDSSTYGSTAGAMKAGEIVSVDDNKSDSKGPGSEKNASGSDQCETETTVTSDKNSNGTDTPKLYIMRHTSHNPEESTTTSEKEPNIPNVLDYDVDGDYPIQQMQRLRRDLGIVRQLRQLLNKLAGEGLSPEELDEKIRNFREIQNSQYDDDLEINVNNAKRSADEDAKTTHDKRWLFRKKKRKKKKAKSVWKHIFGVRSDDNRFLNQNFPNSQYAKYPM